MGLLLQVVVISSKITVIDVYTNCGKHTDNIDDCDDTLNDYQFLDNISFLKDTNGWDVSKEAREARENMIKPLN